MCLQRAHKVSNFGLNPMKAKGRSCVPIGLNPRFQLSVLSAGTSSLNQVLRNFLPVVPGATFSEVDPHCVSISLC